MTQHFDQDEPQLSSLCNYTNMQLANPWTVDATFLQLRSHKQDAYGTCHSADRTDHSEKLVHIHKIIAILWGEINNSRSYLMSNKGNQHQPIKLAKE